MVSWNEPVAPATFSWKDRDCSALTLSIRGRLDLFEMDLQDFRLTINNMFSVTRMGYGRHKTQWKLKKTLEMQPGYTHKREPIQQCCCNSQPCYVLRVGWLTVASEEEANVFRGAFHLGFSSSVTTIYFVLILQAVCQHSTPDRVPARPASGRAPKHRVIRGQELLYVQVRDGTMVSERSVPEENFWIAGWRDEAVNTLMMCLKVPYNTHF